MRPIPYKIAESPEYYPVKLYSFLLSLLDRTLVKFPDYISEAPERLLSEDDITEQLSVFLDENTRGENNPYSLFRFTNQSKVVGKPQKSDIGVRLASSAPSNVICVIEAKRIPTPTGPNRVPSEYIINNGRGGIERFKHELHGKNLPISILVGYLQDSKMQYWFRYFNFVIHLLSEVNNEWNNLDKLTGINEFSEEKVFKFRSVNSRIAQKEIELFHYWIDLN